MKVDEFIDGRVAYYFVAISPSVYTVHAYFSLGRRDVIIITCRAKRSLIFFRDEAPVAPLSTIDFRLIYIYGISFNGLPSYASTCLDVL